MGVECGSVWWVRWKGREVDTSSTYVSANCCWSIHVGLYTSSRASSRALNGAAATGVERVAKEATETRVAKRVDLVNILQVLVFVLVLVFVVVLGFVVVK